MQEIHKECNRSTIKVKIIRVKEGKRKRHTRNALEIPLFAAVAKQIIIGK